MTCIKPLALAAASAAFLLACSKTPSNPHANANTGAAMPTAASTTTACERKLLTAADMDGILSEPVTGTKPLQSDAQTCYFTSASADRGGPKLMVSLRPGHGRTVLATYTSGQMKEYATYKPLAGVGDEAVWLPDLHEVDARKNDLLCVVMPSGISDAFRNAGEDAQQKALGALCNTIFARY